MWNTANAALLKVAESRLCASPQIETDARIATATSAGATARGWRVFAPVFGVTLNEPRRRANVSSDATIKTQNEAAAGRVR